MTKTSLSGASVLLTGASTGIGRELAFALAERGARLVIAARSRARLEMVAAIVADLGGVPPVVIACDLAERGAARQLAEDTLSAVGTVDILINNAGGGVGGSQWAVGDADAAREAFEINYWSPLALVQALVPAMRERRSGTVVNVTSMAQINTWPLFGGYAATKAALAVATETLRLELSGSDVHVIEAIPGPVDTAVQGETRLAPGIERMLNRVPLGDAGVMARRIADAIVHRRSRVIYPRRAAVAYAVPMAARADTRRLAARGLRETDTATLESLYSVVLRTGSCGDSRDAREAWEAERGRS
jgi:short-subunit dehydrogenase